MPPGQPAYPHPERREEPGQGSDASTPPTGPGGRKGGCGATRLRQEQGGKRIRRHARREEGPLHRERHRGARVVGAGALGRSLGKQRMPACAPPNTRPNPAPHLPSRSAGLGGAAHLINFPRLCLLHCLANPSLAFFASQPCAATPLLEQLIPSFTHLFQVHQSTRLNKVHNHP
jgi:hypothetical protein